MPILSPSQNWSIIPAQQLAGVLEQKVLVVGQMLAGGSATAGDLIQDIPNDGSEDTLFGQRSHMAGMVREFKKLNERTQLDAIPLDDASGTAGTAVITATGTSATADATIYVSVGSEKNHRYQVDLSSGDTPTDVASAIDTAFAADDDSPFQASASLGVVTFTCEHDGTLCNDWCVKIEGTIPGITLAITGWTGGATDPTLTGVLDVIGDIRYQTIIWPSNYAVTEVETVLNARFNTSYLILDGVAIQVKKGTLATLKSYANQNSQSLVILGNKTVAETDRDGTAVVEMPDIVASQFAAFKALRLTDTAPLTQYLSTVAPNDQFGGIALASLPYHNTLMPNLTVPDPRDEFTLTEQAELTDNAVSVFGANRAYNSTILGTVVTTYLTNNAGNPDTSYKFLETVETASVIREFFYENFRSRYAQTRLTDGDLIAGRDMANEASIRAFCNTLYNELAENALVQSGSAAVKDFNQNLVITVALSTGTVTVNMAPLLVTQLRVVLGTIQINFGS
jgi:phage tail sheath gpL-like